MVTYCEHIPGSSVEETIPLPKAWLRAVGFADLRLAVLSPL